MQKGTTKKVALKDGEKCCLHCKSKRPLTAFSQLKGRVSEWRSMCWECELSRQQERHHRVATHRVSWQQHEWEERRQQARERSITSRQAYERRQREREDWYD